MFLYFIISTDTNSIFAISSFLSWRHIVTYPHLNPIVVQLPAHRIPHESKTNTPFSQCIVFVAGGGSVTEHLNLQVSISIYIGY